MKAKKYSYRIVLSAAVILFLAGAVTWTAITASQQEKSKTLSGNYVNQEDAKALSGSKNSQEDSKALSGSKNSQEDSKALSGSKTGQEDSKARSDSKIRQEDAYAGLQEKKKIALTFDDGPDSEYTPMLLDGLAERNVKATFFVIGKQAEEQPEIMQRLVKEGHLIGNHTYNHVDIRHMTETAAKEEILKANEVIAKYTGEEPCFLRPPFGNGSSKLEKDIEMIQVLWTIDTMDWACKNESKICNTVYREVKENSIILMHDEYPASVRAALGIIDHLQSEGYEFVTVDQIVMD